MGNSTPSVTRDKPCTFSQTEENRWEVLETGQKGEENEISDEARKQREASAPHEARREEEEEKPELEPRKEPGEEKKETDDETGESANAAPSLDSFVAMTDENVREYFFPFGEATRFHIDRAGQVDKMEEISERDDILEAAKGTLANAANPDYEGLAEALPDDLKALHLIFHHQWIACKERALVESKEAEERKQPASSTGEEFIEQRCALGSIAGRGKTIWLLASTWWSYNPWAPYEETAEGPMHLRLFSSLEQVLDSIPSLAVPLCIFLEKDPKSRAPCLFPLMAIESTLANLLRAGEDRFPASLYPSLRMALFPAASKSD